MLTELRSYTSLANLERSQQCLAQAYAGRLALADKTHNLPSMRIPTLSFKGRKLLKNWVVDGIGAMIYLHTVNGNTPDRRQTQLQQYYY